MKFGFYEKEITPPLGDSMAGYYGPRPAEDVEDRVYAKAVVFASDSEAPSEMGAVLIIDTCNLDKSFCDAVKARVAAFCDIPAENIAVAANHSHYGLPNENLLYEGDAAFMAIVERLAADTVILARKRLQPCSLSYGIGREETTAFNRDIVLDDGAIVTNPKKDWQEKYLRPFSGIDPDLPVLMVRDAEGKPMGAVFTFALHQDTTGKLAFSGDYSAEISHILKDRYGRDFVSLFMIGCCGDINHIDFMNRTPRRSHREIGRILAKEIIATIEEKSAPLAGEKVQVVSRRYQIPRREVTQEMLAHAAEVAKDKTKRKSPYEQGSETSRGLLIYHEKFGGEEHRMVDLINTVFKIGELWLVAIPGEIYHQYGEQIKEQLPGGKWLLTEQANGTAGYVPVPELMDTYIYPAFLTMGSFLPSGSGDIIVAEALAAVKTLEEK